MKKSLLSILCMLCAAFAMQAADITEDFTVANDTTHWNPVLPSANAKSVTTHTSVATGITYSIYDTKFGTYSGSSYIAPQKSGGYISFSLPIDCQSITITNTSNASTAVQIALYIGDDSKATETKTLGTVSSDFVYNIPAASQAKGTVYKLVVANAKNAQFAKLTFKEATSDPVLTLKDLADQTIAIGNGGSFTKNLGISGANLTAPVTVTSSNSKFTLSKSSIEVADLANGVDLTYTNTEAGTETGTVTFTSGSLSVAYNVTAITASHAGTEADPLSVADVISMNNANSGTFYVKGYIIGCINNSKLVSDTTGTYVATNICLADAAGETKTYSCANLVSGSTTRTYLNLLDNPGNLGQQVVVKGTLEAYNSTIGIRNTEYISGLSATVTDYATLKEWIAAAPAGLKQGRVTGNVSVIYQNGSNLYIKDSSATILVYGELTNTYKNGDVLTGITGTYQKTSAGVPEFIPVADSFGTATSGTEVAPEVLAVEDLATDMINNYVEIDKVKLAATETANNYTATDETGSVVVYNKFGLTITEGENITVKGFVGIYSNTLQIMPIEVSAVTGVENVNVNDANAPVEYFNLQGVKVANDNLSNGVYIRRQGTSVSKVLVK